MDKKQKQEYDKEYKKNRKDLIARQSKEYYLAHREERLAYDREYSTIHKDRVRARKKHIEQLTEKNWLLRKKSIAADPKQRYCGEVKNIAAGFVRRINSALTHPRLFNY